MTWVQEIQVWVAGKVGNALLSDYLVGYDRIRLAPVPHHPVFYALLVPTFHSYQ